MEAGLFEGSEGLAASAVHGCICLLGRLHVLGNHGRRQVRKWPLSRTHGPKVVLILMVELSKRPGSTPRAKCPGA